jgi:PqqD family protein of HPr-rel-A system
VTWRLTPGQTLRYRHWQGESVLYNDLSGDTHLLADSAIHVLLVLQAGPAAHSALAASVRREFAGDDGEVDDATVAGLLDELQSLVLIECA